MTSSGSQGYRVLVAGEHKVFRECLASVLDELDGLDVTQQVDSLEKIDQLPPEQRPDLLLLDLSRLDDRVLRQIQQVRRAAPGVKILVLGLSESEGEIMRCVEAGVNGYFPKESSLDELSRTIDLVLSGQTSCSPRIAYSMFAELADLDRRRRRYRRAAPLELTHRETEILQLIADGLSNKKIAERLCLSIHTVKNHVHHILEKLHVEHRWEAVAHAYEKRWLTDRRSREPGSRGRRADN